jgi:hypothetical protein
MCIYAFGVKACICALTTHPLGNEYVHFWGEEVHFYTPTNAHLHHPRGCVVVHRCTSSPTSEAKWYAQMHIFTHPPRFTKMHIFPLKEGGGWRSVHIFNYPLVGYTNVHLHL